MRVGVPREVKPSERRVAMTPAGARELTRRGHEVFVEAGAGSGSALPDAAYVEAGARLVGTAGDLWEVAEMVVKVKEPIPEEYAYLRADLTLFTYLHLAASDALTAAIVESGCMAIAYETVEDESGRLPLLTPMSEIAGRMAAQVGARFLEGHDGGRGILMGGALGVAPARVLVLGAGASGQSAARVAVGMGADTTVLDLAPEQLRIVDRDSGGRIRTRMSSELELEQQVAESDLVIGAVLVRGARAPKLVTRQMLRTMVEGSVLVDIAIDQGGCAETSRVTTHEDPTYVEEGVVHYCVSNMPGAVPRTSTFALTNATLPYVTRLAGGLGSALLADTGLLAGLNAVRGAVTNPGVAEAHGREHVPLSEMLPYIAGTTGDAARN